MERTVAAIHQEAVQGLHLLTMVPENRPHTDAEQAQQSSNYMVSTESEARGLVETQLFPQ